MSKECGITALMILHFKVWRNLRDERVSGVWPIPFWVLESQSVIPTHPWAGLGKLQGLVESSLVIPSGEIGVPHIQDLQ
jgi:hypothetical protein